MYYYILYYFTRRFANLRVASFKLRVNKGELKFRNQKCDLKLSLGVASL